MLLVICKDATGTKVMFFVEYIYLLEGVWVDVLHIIKKRC